MVPKEVNVPFNLTISLEDALVLLSRYSDRKTISDDSAKSTEKGNPPKRQTSQNGERVPTFKKIPIPTLGRVLSAVSGQYGEGIFKETSPSALDFECAGRTAAQKEAILDRVLFKLLDRLEAHKKICTDAHCTVKLALKG
jgi:hypothetical protein